MSYQNKFNQYPHYKTPESGIFWEKGQALPHFSTPDVLDSFSITYFSDNVKNTLTVLQGLVNKTKPRIILRGIKALEEGRETWPDHCGLKREEFIGSFFALIRKYQSELSGVVVYNNESNRALMNLAGTIGGIKNALPVDSVLYDEFEKHGINLPITIDLTNRYVDSGIDFQGMTRVQVYQHMYDNYWKDCTKRVLVSVDPIDHYAYIRDMAAAVGAAVVWLDPRNDGNVGRVLDRDGIEVASGYDENFDEKKMLHKFLDDLTAGESILLGWYAEERSGIGSGTSHGVGTIPSDYYENSTVYSGQEHAMRPPAVPKKPALENKIYISIFLSDGDNVQYCQHRMSVLWDDKSRGSFPINWTVSPGLADVGPGLLNYYYDTATDNDCFCSGPSGLGYALIYDSHNKIFYLKDKDLADKYAKLSEQYLAKTGIRTVTVWDLLSDPFDANSVSHYSSYEKYCRSLYGLTLEDWFRQPAPLSIYTENKRLPFAPNYPAYGERTIDIYNHMEEAIKAWDGSAPLFLAGQGVSWSMTADNLHALSKEFDKLHPGKIEFLRADHFFALLNESNGNAYNLALSADVKCSVPAAANGSHSVKSVVEGESVVKFDLPREYTITRYVVKNAGFAGLDPSLNTKELLVEVSADGTNWTEIDRQTDNAFDAFDVDVEATKAKFVRFTVVNAGSDSVARIADIELYGF